MPYLGKMYCMFGGCKWGWRSAGVCGGRGGVLGGGVDTTFTPVGCGAAASAPLKRNPHQAEAGRSTSVCYQLASSRLGSNTCICMPVGLKAWLAAAAVTEMLVSAAKQHTT